MPRILETELVSSSIGFTHKKRFLKLKFVFTVSGINAIDQPSHNGQRIGELLLVYDENLGFVDENWLLDINSPFWISNFLTPEYCSSLNCNRTLQCLPASRMTRLEK